MADKIKILCFAGSLRRDSLNKKLVRASMELAQEAGAEVTYVDLKDYPLPVYDGDIEAEQGVVENARKLKVILKQHQALLIASPEYNSSISGALKNMIDWTSRPEPGEGMLACFQGKVAGIMAASPGALGGLRGLVSLRMLLGNIGIIVVPEQLAVAKAVEAFDASGKLKDSGQQENVRKIVARVIEVTKGIAG